jgi:hypothetical protein
VPNGGSASDAVEIADAVAIAVAEAAGINLVDNCFLPPLGAGFRANGELRNKGQCQIQETSAAHA